MNSSLRLGAFALAAAVCAAAAPAQADDKTVVALVASAATGAMKELVPLYQRSHPGVTVTPAFGGAQVLAAQIEAGAAADLIVVGTGTMARLGGKVEAPMPVFKYHEAVLVPKSGSKIHGLKDLGAKGVRIALPTADSPPAVYMRAMLEKASALYGPDFAKNVEANAVTRKPAASGMPAAVASGVAEAAIGFSSDESDTIAALAVPASVDVVTTTDGAVIKGSAHADLAKDFLAFLHSPEAQQILKKHHFDL